MKEQTDVHKKIVGIDPGVKGALALIEVDGNDEFELANVCPMPIEPYFGINYYSAHSIDCYVSMHKAALFIVERPLFFAKQSFSGQTQSFINYGILIHSLLYYECDFRETDSRVWQKVIFADCEGGTSKQKSIECAKVVFPHTDLRRTDKSRKDDDNFADAINMAVYGYMLYQQEEV